MIILAEDASQSISPLVGIILVLVLTLINAFFAGSELAVLSVNENKIKVLADKGNKRAKLVLKLNQNETKFLSTIQVGITLAGLFSGATVSASLSDDLANFLVSMGLQYMPTLCMVILTLILSYITIVLGELFPKRIALRFPEKFALISAPVINIISIIATPFVKLLQKSCDALAFIFRLNKKENESQLSEAEIRLIISTGKKEGVISNTEADYIDRILNFDDLCAKDILTPRTKCFTINLDDPIEKQILELKSEKYTRVPVYKDSIDQITGILNLKDILFAMETNEFKDVCIKNLLRKPLFIPTNITLPSLLKKFRETNNQMAIVIDEFGGFAGLVTLEDVVEELVGNIEDEYDDNASSLVKTNNNGYIIDANTNISDFNYRFKKSISFSDDYSTINGLLIYYLGHIPKTKEKVVIDDITFIVNKASKKKVESVEIMFKKEA